MKRIFSHVLVLSLLVSFFTIPINKVLASGETEHQNSVPSTTTYEINENDQIIESVNVEINNLPLIMERIINPDGTSVTYIEYGSEYYIETANLNYDKFYQIASSYVYYSTLPAMLACNLQTSNFRHVYVGEAAPSTFSVELLNQFNTVAKVTGFIASNILKDIPLAACAFVAQLIFEELEDKAPGHFIKIYSTTYEVRFSYDNVYYTHCYHNTLFCYDEDGNYTKTLYDYYQAIGG